MNLNSDKEQRKQYTKKDWAIGIVCIVIVFPFVLGVMAKIAVIGYSVIPW